MALETTNSTFKADASEIMKVSGLAPTALSVDGGAAPGWRRWSVVEVGIDADLVELVAAGETTP